MDQGISRFELKSVTDSWRTGQELIQANPSDWTLFAGLGGTCFGHLGFSGMVFDHRFDRYPGPGPTNFPSSALTIIYHAKEIADWGKRCQSTRPLSPIHLVTHRGGDFDSCLGLYLARRILEQPELAENLAFRGYEKNALISPLAFMGGLPDGVIPFRWQRPEWARDIICPLDKSRKALVLLAVVASFVKKSRPLSASFEGALDNVFLAARKRKRFECPDATDFFRLVETRIVQDGFDPLNDGFEDGDPDFKSELRFIVRQRELYKDDLARARRSVAFVARSVEPFSQWAKQIPSKFPFGPVFTETFWTELASGRPGRDPFLQNMLQSRLAVDALFLRDPNCCFFTEWARADRITSPLGKGFTLLAIAQTGVKRSEELRPNRSRYVISLDPEWARCEHIHLMDLWAKLQSGEIRNPVISFKGDFSRRPASRIFFPEGGMELWGEGAWWSGAKVDTPIRGTTYSEGKRSNLSDDGVGLVALDHLTSLGFGEAKPHQRDFSWGESILKDEICGLSTFQANGFRFVRILRLPISDLGNTLPDPVDEQMAERLWEWIQPVGTRGLPHDFAERHLVHRGEWVAVWNRRGIAIAHTSSAEAIAYSKNLETEVATLARLTGEIRGLLRDGTRNEARLGQLEEKLHRGTEALAELAELHLRAQAGQSPVLRPFMEANGIMELASMVESMNRIRLQEKVEVRERRRDDRLQQTLAVASAAAIFLAWLQMERVGLTPGDQAAILASDIRAWLIAGFGGLFVSGFLLWAFRSIKGWN